MAEHIGSSRMALPTSHRQTRVSVEHKPLIASYDERARARQAQRDRERLVQREVKKLCDLSIPRDGIIRAVSSVMAKRPPKHQSFADFRRLVRIYCSLALGFEGRHVVQTYLYVRLNQMVTQKRADVRAKAIELIREEVTRPQWLKAQLSFLHKPLERADLERMAYQIFNAIQVELVSKASDRHRRGHSASQKRYIARRIEISAGGGVRTGFLIVNMSKGKPRIVALKTSVEYKASRMHGTRPKQEYRNGRNRHRGELMN